jgi:hypothetical protein
MLCGTEQRTTVVVIENPPRASKIQKIKRPGMLPRPALNFYYFAPAFRAFAFAMPILIARLCDALNFLPRSLLPSLLISISLGTWLIARGA